MLVVALIVNNIQRRYPVFWFKPIIEPPAPVEPALGGPEEDGDDDEEEAEGAATGSSSREDVARDSSTTASVRSVSRTRSEVAEKQAGKGNADVANMV